MIKFFRNIRKRLLSENKPSQYLLYALGEILLVVIGILIALQINNWNEEQKEKSLEINYIKGLISDLEYDVRAFNTVIDGIDNHRKSTNAVLNCYKDQQSLPDSALLYHLSQLSIISRYSHRSTVMEEMKSSGRLYLIRTDSIRQEVTQYYKMADNIMSSSEKNNDWILNHIIASPVMINNFDFNSTVSHSDFLPDIMKSPEVDSFSGLPFVLDEESLERKQIVNLLTALNWLNGLNQSYGINGRASAQELKERLMQYLATIDNG